MRLSQPEWQPEAGLKNFFLIFEIFSGLPPSYRPERENEKGE
jgi:hypothetical protein